ncbi:MAG: GHMP kinase [Methanobacteriota archaeon]|nr:MAG: GHMP kinase [Euryarchaeota archaeon]TLZ97413.1 MAG: GHMP kinase [Euryarchaeota archaeon]TMA02569.1 MAG: GHMP kinase [Euryarchaeota archaeon]
MVSEGEAFCPGHATAFFEVHEDPDPRAKGSRGAGLSLSLGVRTVAKVREARRSSLDIMVNERRQKAEVTQRVVEKLTGSRSLEIKILSETPLPVSQGFGVSAAAALSTALALDEALGGGLPRDELVAIAHETEVECATGLGDVVPASLGGMDLRWKPGAPGYSEVRTFPVQADLLLAVLGQEIPTKSILRDAPKVATINRVGGALVDEFSRSPSFERLFDLGNRFAEETGLANRTMLEVIRASRMFGRATMAMLGNSLFATGNSEQLASLYRKFGTLQRCEVDNEGARVL